MKGSLDLLSCPRLPFTPVKTITMARNSLIPPHQLRRIKNRDLLPAAINNRQGHTVLYLVKSHLDARGYNMWEETFNVTHRAAVATPSFVLYLVIIRLVRICCHSLENETVCAHHGFLFGDKNLAPESQLPVLYTKYIGCCGSFDSAMSLPSLKIQHALPVVKSNSTSTMYLCFSLSKLSTIKLSVVCFSWLIMEPTCAGLKQVDMKQKSFPLWASEWMYWRFASVVHHLRASSTDSACSSTNSPGPFISIRIFFIATGLELITLIEGSKEVMPCSYVEGRGKYLGTTTLAIVAIKIFVFEPWGKDICPRAIIINMVHIPSQHKSSISVFFLPVGYCWIQMVGTVVPQIQLMPKRIGVCAWFPSQEQPEARELACAVFFQILDLPGFTDCDDSGNEMVGKSSCRKMMSWYLCGE